VSMMSLAALAMTPVAGVTVAVTEVPSLWGESG
jgi:hypothetical protein